MMLMLVVSKYTSTSHLQSRWALLKLYCMHRLRRREAVGDWRNVHNSYCAVHVDSSSVVNSRRNQWVRHVAAWESSEMSTTF